MRVLVPSYKRAGSSSTMDLIPCAMAVVPESQGDDYEKHYPGRVITIPDDQDGNVAKKRNAVLGLVGDGELFWMLDDDLVKVTRIKQGEETDIEATLESHWHLMESYGADYGGFSVTSDPVRYLEYLPFSLTKPSYGGVCIRKREGLAYDETLGRYEDADYFLKCIHRGGRVLRDNRIYMLFDCNKALEVKKNAGGIEGNENDWHHALDVLTRRWGKKVIKIKNGVMNGISTPLKGP